MWEEKREVESKVPDIPNLTGWGDYGITGRETNVLSGWTAITNYLGLGVLQITEISSSVLEVRALTY